MDMGKERKSFSSNKGTNAKLGKPLGLLLSLTAKEFQNRGLYTAQLLNLWQSQDFLTIIT
ncbi:hypothetical protein CIPAW_07G033100 [Carya illinoinensis]|uniref:Uncharacterized protein n=1 Tax=Carya illinoinensis TaxID=32201 RepID=A0A8T1PYX0_CARIL|nr:hypothetical protein CIPAW_07G033100 [Carya illinoinensis]